MHLGALPDGRANAPEAGNTLLPLYRVAVNMANSIDQAYNTALKLRSCLTHHSKGIPP